MDMGMGMVFEPATRYELGLGQPDSSFYHLKNLKFDFI
ncbi:hypothetical protein Pint_30608 [Pistacia integerrima]|uniref:Uncharacterized protein n=1 Tax=Pistacia integerrima TaxID=434235 RepID=A0ACC0WZE6_9ROSI|nr:hypothetical protein Pint_30608 [Pistacia integerrima]